jgi:hypothetical protein
VIATVTLPRELRRPVRGHQKILYEVLFKAAFAALAELCGSERRLRGDIGALAVLHTWTRTLAYHPSTPPAPDADLRPLRHSGVESPSPPPLQCRAISHERLAPRSLPTPRPPRESRRNPQGVSPSPGLFNTRISDGPAGARYRSLRPVTAKTLFRWTAP